LTSSSPPSTIALSEYNPRLNIPKEEMGMAERIGQQLGNYRLVRQIGKGGFAEVYLSEHAYLKTQAAIKLLPIYNTIVSRQRRA